MFQDLALRTDKNIALGIEAEGLAGEQAAGLDASIAARVTMHETAVNCETFARNNADLTALLDHFLKQHAVNIGLAKPAVAVLGEGRMIWHGSFQPQPAEPAIGQVEMHLIAQLPLGTNAISLANE